MSEPRMQLTSSATRPTRAEQITEILRTATQQGDVLRVRIPFSLYDHVPGNRKYVDLRDATWTIAMPLATTTVASVEAVIQAIGVSLAAITQHGPEAVIGLLSNLPLTGTGPTAEIEHEG